MKTATAGTAKAKKPSPPKTHIAMVKEYGRTYSALGTSPSNALTELQKEFNNFDLKKAQIFELGLEYRVFYKIELQEKGNVT